jgi:hypothetical protein
MKMREIKLRDDVREIDEKDFKCNMDKKGFFLIRLNQDNKKIEVGWCNYNYEITHVFKGRDVEKLYKTIIKEIDVENKQHLAYLGKELQRAKHCLDSDSKYVQE